MTFHKTSTLAFKIKSKHFYEAKLNRHSRSNKKQLTKSHRKKKIDFDPVIHYWNEYRLMIVSWKSECEQQEREKELYIF
jgi:hypothetical protein